MIEEYFNLRQPPFKLGTDPGFYYDSESHRKAMAYLQYGLQQAEGIVVVTGDAGVGKSMLIEQLCIDIDEAQVTLACLRSGHIPREEVLDHVLAAFRIEATGRSKVARLEALEAFLADQQTDGQQTLLIVDEAQHLSEGALQELRILTNITAGGVPLLQVFLVGQSELKDMLAAPAMEQFRQRIVASCHLSPLDEDETASYIDYRLYTAGWEDEESVFTDVAHKEIYTFTRGIPRKVNMLCTRVLLQTAIDESEFVDSATVRKVITELKAEALDPEPEEHIAEEMAEEEIDERATADGNVVHFLPGAETVGDTEDTMQASGDEEPQTDPEVQPFAAEAVNDSGPVDEMPPAAETSFVTETPVSVQPVSEPLADLGFESTLDRLSRRRQSAESAQPTPAETVDDPFQEEPGEGSMEELAEQISAVLTDVTAPPPEEEAEELQEELPVITEIGTGTTPELDPLKGEITEFVAELRETLLAAGQRMDVVSDRVDELEDYRLERARLVNRRLKDVEALLDKLRGQG